MSFKAGGDAPRTTIDDSYLLWCGASFVMISSALASAYFYYDRRTIQNLFRKHVKDALEKDLKDPVGAYDLRCCIEFPGFEPTGPSGLWVAEDGGQVIGVVSLSNLIIRIAQESHILTFHF
jgi:hypothetical protein